MHLLFWYNPAMTKERNPQVHIASASYTVFGKLKSVEESEGYLILTNEDDQQRFKSKKILWQLETTKASAETLIGQEIVTMFGGGGMYSPYSWEPTLMMFCMTKKPKMVVC